MPFAIELAIALLAGYLLGSIPSGLLLTRWAGAGDLRQVGSGNIGATNVLRTGRKGLAAATLIADGLKGAFAVLIGAQFGAWPAIAGGVAAFAGHIFPVWLGFKGGKGVATFIGVTLALSWPAGLLVCATWLAMAFSLKISSLSALVAAALSPLYMLLLGEQRLAAVAFILALMIWGTHHQNIRRLIQGQEPKIGAKK